MGASCQLPCQAESERTIGSLHPLALHGQQGTDALDAPPASQALTLWGCPRLLLMPPLALEILNTFLTRIQKIL